MTTAIQSIIQSKVPGKFDNYVPHYEVELSRHYQQVSARLNPRKISIPISCNDVPVQIPIRRIKPPKPDIVALPSVLVPTIEDVMDAVIHHYQVSLYDLTGPIRRCAWIRQVAMWLCCRLTGESTGTIGKAMSRDHTTVIHGRDSVQRKYESDPKIANELVDVICKVFEEAKLACAIEF